MPQPQLHSLERPVLPGERTLGAAGSQSSPQPGWRPGSGGDGTGGLSLPFVVHPGLEPRTHTLPRMHVRTLSLDLCPLSLNYLELLRPQKQEGSVNCRVLFMYENSNLQP